MSQMNPLLKARLGPLVRRHGQLLLWSRLAACWLAMALLGLGLLALQRRHDWISPWGLFPLVAFGAAAASAIVIRHRRSWPDWRRMAQRVEEEYPELEGLLLTAVQQQAKAGGELGYLQEQVVRQAVELGERNAGWTAVTPLSRVVLVHLAHLSALAFCAAVLWGLAPRQAADLALAADRVTVTPGDTSLERGASLVIMARFARRVPAKVDLVLDPALETSRRIPLTRSLADPMFGGSVPEVTSNLVYRLEYEGRQTRNFRVKVYEHPRLERADVELTYPGYTGLPPKRIEQTSRVSAVEGTLLELALQLNKPVAAARLVPKGASPGALALVVDTNRPVATLSRFPLAVSRAYDLQLVDADGRTNKLSAQFSFEVLPNRRPEVKLVAPRGDIRPSALEEVQLAGTVWDDFGIGAYGVAYTQAGQPAKVLELGRAVPGKERRAFAHLLRLEDLGASPEDFLSWYAWAEDVGPDGQPRRTTSDLFFAEVRPFEEVFREGQGQDGQRSQPEQSGEQPEQPGSQSARLAELQKQIISATWRLLPEQAGAVSNRPAKPSQFKQDTAVVRDSQAQALKQAEAAKERALDPRLATQWGAVTLQMEKALEKLKAAPEAPAALPEALSAEQAAYQALLKLQEREYAVTRSRGQRGGQAGGGRQQQMQRQLDQLELTQAEDRYETQRQAQAPPSAERREQLQVLNRLRELARRQQDVNERLRELQTALQAARTEQEREEVRRRLKRLQEEEQQMLADVDELQQRLDRPDNQARLSEPRQQLDQARQDMQRAAEAARQGAASQALAAGARAQRRLSQMRDDLRQESAGEFAEDLRQMRAEARELTLRQEEIQANLDALTRNPRRTLSDSDQRQQALERLDRQKERLTNLVQRVTQVSQQTEDAEPLVSRELYDALRAFSQDDANHVSQLQEELLNRGMLTRSLYERLRRTAEREGAKSLELTAEMLRQDFLPQADQAEQRARAGIGNLRRGVERAAERVLGDDTEALRRAQRELEELTGELEREMVQAERRGATNTVAQAGQGGGRQDGPADAGPHERPGEARPSERGPASLRDTAPAEGPVGTERPAGAQTNGRGGRGGWLTDSLERFFDGNLQGTGPIIGEDFASWSDRLREVEEIVEIPLLRNDIALARTRAQQFRQAYQRELKKPDWAIVRLQVVKPLLEVRNQLADELARRGPKDNLAPVDRDPVPPRYSELVRRYYERLGKDQ